MALAAPDLARAWESVITRPCYARRMSIKGAVARKGIKAVFGILVATAIDWFVQDWKGKRATKSRGTVVQNDPRVL